MEQIYSTPSDRRMSETQAASHDAITNAKRVVQNDMVMSHFTGPAVKLTRWDLFYRTNLPMGSVCRVARGLLDAGRLTVSGERKCEATGAWQELLSLADEPSSAAAAMAAAQ
ncbi:hypothetical protein [Cupriavidus necator]|uniref:hypothetical protein n=1 Tax=Cupriavidus necator TaxID=106590 RepID=UPI0005B4A00C|nr:hypothetical protein [Cupriavidus necator]